MCVNRECIHCCHCVILMSPQPQEDEINPKTFLPRLKGTFQLKDTWRSGSDAASHHYKAKFTKTGNQAETTAVISDYDLEIKAAYNRLVYFMLESWQSPS